MRTTVSSERICQTYYCYDRQSGSYNGQKFSRILTSLVWDCQKSLVKRSTNDQDPGGIPDVDTCSQRIRRQRKGGRNVEKVSNDTFHWPRTSVWHK